MSGKTGTTEAHRSSGFFGFTNDYAAANYIYDDSTSPSDLCSFPLRQCGSGNLYGGNEPARTWFTAMKQFTPDDVALPPTDPRYVDGAPGSKVPSVAGMTQDLARQRLKDAGFQVADQATPVNSGSPAGAVVGTSPTVRPSRGRSSRSRSATAFRPLRHPRRRDSPPSDPNDPNAIPAPVGSTVVHDPWSAADHGAGAGSATAAATAVTSRRWATRGGAPSMWQ